MAIKIRRGAGAPGVTLEDGELGLDTTNDRLYVGNSSTNTLLADGVIDEGTTDGALARWDTGNSKWQENTNVTIDDATGKLTIGGTEQTQGFKYFSVLTQSAYNMLTPDPDTVYFIT